MICSFLNHWFSSNFRQTPVYRLSFVYILGSHLTIENQTYCGFYLLISRVHFKLATTSLWHSGHVFHDDWCIYKCSNWVGYVEFWMKIFTCILSSKPIFMTVDRMLFAIFARDYIEISLPRDFFSSFFSFHSEGFHFVQFLGHHVYIWKLHAFIKQLNPTLLFTKWDHDCMPAVLYNIRPKAVALQSQFIPSLAFTDSVQQTC